MTFWKQNLYEHAVILYDTLSPMEREVQDTARQYIPLFKKWVDLEGLKEPEVFIRE